MNRAEHVEWAKQRALAELDADPHGRGPITALTSIISDLRKHPETQAHNGIELSMMLIVSGGNLISGHEVRKHIEGFR